MILLFALIITVLFFIISYRYIYMNLDVGQEPEKSDVIIVLEGSVPDRAYQGVDLLLDGYSSSDKIIVSPGTGWNLPFYTDRGASRDQLIVEEEATSTWTNATNTIDIMEEKGWDSAIVVTTDFHMRRSRLSFERASLGKDLDFNYVSSYKSYGGPPESYLENPVGQYNGRRDTLKYFGYMLGMYQLVDLDN